MYLAGNGATTIARTLGNNRSEGFIKYNLLKLGYSIKKPGDYRKYKLNEHYFDEINTHEKAYWLGFLYADGYNHEGRNEVKICLNTRDTNHIEKFREAIESNLPIKQNACNRLKDSIQIVICSKPFSRALAKHGCTQAKSFTIRMPKLEEEVYPSFLRGYFDGDGSVSGKRKKGNFNITSNYNFLNDYQQKLVEKCGVNKTKLGTKKITAHKPTMEKAWALCYTGANNLRKIYNYLYSTNIYSMPRKKLKFQELITELPPKQLDNQPSAC